MMMRARTILLMRISCSAWIAGLGVFALSADGIVAERGAQCKVRGRESSRLVSSLGCAISQLAHSALEGNRGSASTPLLCDPPRRLSTRSPGPRAVTRPRGTARPRHTRATRPAGEGVHQRRRTGGRTSDRAHARMGGPVPGPPGRGAPARTRPPGTAARTTGDAADCRCEERATNPGSAGRVGDRRDPLIPRLRGLPRVRVATEGGTARLDTDLGSARAPWAAPARSHPDSTAAHPLRHQAAAIEPAPVRPAVGGPGPAAHGPADARTSRIPSASQRTDPTVAEATGTPAQRRIQVDRGSPC